MIANCISVAVASGFLADSQLHQRFHDPLV
jgi:hypothetical protein